MGILDKIKNTFKSEDNKNFTYLNQLINSGQKEIKLEHDIILKKGEEKKFHEGIIIDVNDVIIDGNGHTIDAKGKTCIFKAYNRNITIMNMTLKNGYASNYGGAIYAEGRELIISNVDFINNESKKAGGAILNMSTMTILDSMFKTNTSEHGGAIINLGDLTVENTEVHENSSRYGAVLNAKHMKIKNSCLKGNAASTAGGSIFNKGTAVLSNSKIESNNARDFGCAIVNENVMKITDCQINGNGEENVKYVLGSIFNSGKLTLSNVEMQKNNVEHGSCIFNNGEAFVSDSRLKGNSAFNGIVYNRSFMRLASTTIEENNGPTLFNTHHLQIIDGEIKKNKSQSCIIGNMETIDIYNGTIHENESENMILTEYHGKLNLSEGEIIKNRCKILIQNEGKSINISKTRFENPLASEKIHNASYLYLNDPKMDDDGAIYNNGRIFLKKLRDEYLDKIYGDGEIISVAELSGKNNFTYLDGLIHDNDSNEIELDADIILNNNEVDFYEGGILLDYDNLVIDGKDHTIDANGLSRIFVAAGENITLKNITFRNGYNNKNYNNGANNFGGVLRVLNFSSVTLKNCTFTDNYSEVHGGAIDNVGKLEIFDSCFERNSVDEGYGGAISNQGEISIHNTALTENTASKLGGALLNHKNGKVKIINCQFTGNKLIEFSGESYGGAISNDGKLSIKDSALKGNCSKKSGGGISNDFNGTISMDNVEFSKNRAKMDSGGAIYNEGKITIKNSTFNENTAYNGAGGVIYNNSNASIKELMKRNTLNRSEASLGLVGIVFNKTSISVQSTDFYNDVENDEKSNPSEIYIKTSIIKDNNAGVGAGLWNGNEMELVDTLIESNSAERNGGAISNVNANMIINNCQILKNTAENNGGAIFNYGDSKITMKNSKLNQNSSKNSKSISDEKNAKTIIIDCEIDDM